MSAVGRIRARELAYAQWSHEQRRDAVPITAGDDWEKVARIEAQLIVESNPTNRSILLRELTRLREVLT